MFLKEELKEINDAANQIKLNVLLLKLFWCLQLFWESKLFNGCLKLSLFFTPNNNYWFFLNTNQDRSLKLAVKLIFLIADSSQPRRFRGSNFRGHHDRHWPGLSERVYREADSPGRPRADLSRQERLVHQPDGHQRKCSSLDSVRLSSSGNSSLPAFVHGD